MPQGRSRRDSQAAGFQSSLDAPMSLADEYKRQARWRDWEAVLRLLPLRAGERVLDLGCALGDQSAMLAARGAQVVGVDANAELLAQADRRAIPGASFVQADAADVSGLGLDPVDGIWSSFTAAYFPDFGPVLASWLQLLRPGGWIALVEMDDPEIAEFFGTAEKPETTQGRHYLMAYLPSRTVFPAIPPASA